MNIIEKMMSDLETVKALRNHGEAFKQECFALEIAIEDYQHFSKPSVLYHLDVKFSEETIERDAFTYALNSLMSTLTFYADKPKEYFRETYLKRYVYSIRMLSYYEKLYLNEVDQYMDFIESQTNLYQDANTYWYEDLYFFSEKMNGAAGLPEQETHYDDTIIDISPIMERDLTHLAALKDKNDLYYQEYISLEIAVTDFKNYMDPEFIGNFNVKVDEEFPELDSLNRVLGYLENTLHSYIVGKSPLRDVYIKRYTYCLRMLSYYFSIYMKTSYRDIIDTYQQMYPGAGVHWTEPLYFFGEDMNNVAPFKPRCPHCRQDIEEGISQGEVEFCSAACANEALWLSTQFAVLGEISGLSSEELKTILVQNNWSLDRFAEKLDEINEVIKTGYAPAQSFIQSFNHAAIYNKLYENLSRYKVMRGGKQGFKGFVFEELHAASASLGGTPTHVLGNNQLADFMILNPDGGVSYGQAKAGYNNQWVDFKKYEGQVLIVDQGNVELKTRAQKAGLSVIESPVSLFKAEKIADAMQVEKKVFEFITGKPRVNAPITSAAVTLGDAAFKSARYGGLASAGYSIGNNTIELLYGEKSFAEASASIAKDTAIGTATSMGVGLAVQGASIALQAVARTKAGMLVSGAVSSASSMLAGTAVGSTILTGTAAIGSTLAAGAGVVTSVTTAALGTTLAGTAAGAAVIAGAPIVAGAAVVGGAIALGKRLLRGY